jgi:hypothetical protein
MLLASSVSGLFKWRQFEPEVILLAVGWYLRFSLSYRDVEELLAKRGLHADHVTVWRWVQRYAPEWLRTCRLPLNSGSPSDPESCIRALVQAAGLNKGTDLLGKPPNGRARFDSRPPPAGSAGEMPWLQEPVPP